MRTILAYIMALLASGSIIPAAHAKQFPPSDQCLAVDGYYALRQNLERIAKVRDTKALIALADPHIDSDFSGAIGSVDAFIQNFSLKKGEESYIWEELDRLLQLGCFVADDHLIWPAMDVASELVTEVDGYSKGAQDGSSGYGVVIGQNINLYDTPNSKAMIVTKLNWDFYDFEAYSENREWMQIR